MGKIKLIAVIIFITFSHYSSLAQSNYAKAARVSEIDRLIDVPVGLYTGTPNINIPLCALKTTKSEIPISLSYNASGIKVDQLASDVGLGWSLLTGGYISRTIRGKPDNGTYHTGMNFNGTNYSGSNFTNRRALLVTPKIIV